MPRFITKKWIEVHDQFGESHSDNKQIRFKTPMLQSDLCDYNDAYIVVNGTTTVTGPNNNAFDKKFTFENNSPFFSCISKINNRLIDNAEELDIAIMPMYNLIAYTKNCSKITESL